MKFILKNINKKFDGNVIYKDASVCLEEGKIYGLLGRNGAGKTTLFNCISGELDFDSGEMLLMEGEKKAKLSYGDVGYVLATPMLPDFMTGYEFIQFYMDINHVKDTKSPEYYLDLVGISKSDGDKLIIDYSLGMKNKLQLLMPVIAKPKIVLMDEPLTSFDIIVAEEMKKLLAEMKKDRIIMFSTHIIQLAEEMCDDLILVCNKKLEILQRKSLNKSEMNQIIIEKISNDSGI